MSEAPESAQHRLVLAFLILAGIGAAQNPKPADPGYVRGAALHHSGDCRAAVQELKNSADPRARLLLASCYLSLDDHKSAIAALDAHLRAASDDIEALGMIATAYERDGRGAEGAKLLEAYLKKNPDDAAIQIRLGSLYASMGQEAPAAKQFQAVTAVQPENAAALAGMGLLALKQKRWTEAIDLFHKAEKDIPDDPAIEEGLSAAYLALDQCENALAPLKAAQRLSPIHYGIAKSLAGCYRKLRNWNEVIVALRTGTDQESADGDATAWMLEAYAGAGRKGEAEEYLRWALSRTPANVSARLALGNMLFDAGKLKEARTEYVEYIKLTKAPAQIHHRVAKIYDSEAQAADARKFYEAASSATDATQEMHIDLARLCFKANDLVCTRATLDKIPAAEAPVPVKRMRVDLEYRQQKWEEVFRLASELLPQDPKSLELVSMAAESALKLGKLPEGTELLERAIALNPADKTLVIQLAGLYTDNESLNKVGRATELLVDYVAKFPQDGELYLMLGNLYRKSKDMDNAKVNFRLGFERVPTPTPARLSWAYISYSALLWEDGRQDEALLYQKQATQLNPDDEVAQYNLAQMCLRLGKEEDLAAAQEKLRSLNSKFVADLDEQIEKFKSAPQRKKKN